MQCEPDYRVFSSERVGIDTDKLAYFAVSVVWRSGIHKWKTIGNQATSVVLATQDEGRIRKYLLGETELPANVGVVITVCTDLASQVLVQPPTMLGNAGGYLIYRLLIRGIEFNVLVATAPNIQFPELCCVRSPAKRIFLKDNSQLTLNSVRHFYEESKLARNVRPKL
jgi:hypothetical protein